MSEHPLDVDLIMLHRDLRGAPSFALPQEYHMWSYRSGDLDTWQRLQATDPFFAPIAAVFAEVPHGDDAVLAEQVISGLTPWVPRSATSSPGTRRSLPARASAKSAGWLSSPRHRGEASRPLCAASTCE
jgi:hypothetical protein